MGNYDCCNWEQGPKYWNQTCCTWIGLYQDPSADETYDPEASFDLWRSDSCSSTYRKWSSDEPNQYMGWEEDCAMYGAWGYMSWNDYGCSNKLRCLCEFTVDNATEVAAPPPAPSPVDCDAVDWKSECDPVTCIDYLWCTHALEDEVCKTIGAQCYPCQKYMHCLEGESESVVHGDPMFKHNGTSMHFWIKEGELTPLLSWTAPGREANKMKLSGVTYSRENSGNQWFEQLVVSKDGKDLVDVKVDRVGGKMNVELAGVPVEHVGDLSWRGGVTVTSSKRHGRDYLHLQAGGLQIDMDSYKAQKFKDETTQKKFQHLNLKFTRGIPNIIKPSGILAELHGATKMSDATKAMLKPGISKHYKREKEEEMKPEEPKAWSP